MESRDNTSTREQLSPPQDFKFTLKLARVKVVEMSEIFSVYLGIQMNFYLNPDELIAYHVVYFLNFLLLMALFHVTETFLAPRFIQKD